MERYQVVYTFVNFHGDEKEDFWTIMVKVSLSKKQKT